MCKHAFKRNLRMRMRLFVCVCVFLCEYVFVCGNVCVCHKERSNLCTLSMSWIQKLNFCFTKCNYFIWTDIPLLPFNTTYVTSLYNIQKKWSSSLLLRILVMIVYKKLSAFSTKTTTTIKTATTTATA